jgi:hypothetical protein
VKIDPKLQAQVWQRVQGEQPRPGDQQMALLEAETAAQIQALMAYYPGKRQILQKMLTQCQDHLACLRGVEYLRRGLGQEMPAVKPRLKDEAAVVRKCYVNCLNLANLYEQNRSDPEYGLVYGEMARVKGQQCMQLLMLLGQNRKK